MARVPSVAPAGGVAGRARQALVNPVVPAPSGNPLEIIASAVFDVTDFVERDMERRDHLKAAVEEERFRTVVEERVAELDPLAKDYDEQVRRVYDEARREAVSSADFATSRVAEEFGARLQMRTEADFRAHMASRRQALAVEAERAFGVATDALAGQIRADPDGAETYLEDFRSQLSGIYANLPAETHAAFDEQLRDKMLVAQVEGLAAEGRFDDARALADERQGELEPGTFRNLKGIITARENEARSDRLAATSAKIADFEIAILDAVDDGELRRRRQELERMDEAGLFEGRQGVKARLAKYIEARRAALKTDRADELAAWSKYASGTGVDSRREADYAWARYREKLPDDLTAEQYLAHGVEFARTSGFAPTEFHRLAENAERVDNPDQLAFAARWHDEVDFATDGAVDSGANKDASRVRLTSAYVELLGTSYEQAARQVVAGLPDAAALKERRERFEVDFEDFDARDVLDAEDVFDDPDEVTAPAARDFERMVRLNYELSGDADLAVASSVRRMRELYGLTGVGGDRTVLHPPERNFPGSTNGDLSPAAKTGILEAEIGRRMAALGVEPGVAVEGEEVGEPFRLSADRQTELELARGERPSYRVLVRTDIPGLYSPVVTVDPNTGRPVEERLVMPTVSELQQYPEYAAIAEEEVERAQRRRARHGRMRQIGRGRAPTDLFDIGPGL